MMKGEYLVENHQNNHNYNTECHVFPKFTPHNHPSFPFADENPAVSSKKPKTSPDDGGSVELPRRPRGRPPGSKNKPRQPVFVTHEPETVMSPYILELPSGSNIVDSLTRFTRRRGISICILTASGAVANLTLKQPAQAGPTGSTVTFHGRFDILSLSSVLMPQTAPFGDNDFGVTISVAGPQGQIVGGMVVGPLISSGIVYVVATSFNSPSFHRLPLGDDEEEGRIPAVGAGEGQSESPVSGGSSGGGQMGMYNSCQMGSSFSEVMWANSSVRPSLPHRY